MKCRRQVDVGLQPFHEVLVSQPEKRRLALQHHNRVALVRHVDLRDPPREVRARVEGGEQPRRENGPPLVDGRPSGSRSGLKTIDDRQIELHVVGSVLVDDHAARIHEVELAPDAADPHRLTLGDRRSRSSTAAGV